MLARYQGHALAEAPTLGTEVEFNLQLDGVRLRGLIDRVAEMDGRLTLVDYKTNQRLEGSLLDAYRTQLQLYGLAAQTVLFPNSDPARLILFDLRLGREMEVEPAAERVQERVEAAGRRIAANDFELRPEHESRPCFACAFKSFCPDAR